MRRSSARIVRELGPFEDVSQVNGVSFDGTRIWIATGDTLNAIDVETGATVKRLAVPAHAGTAFDGKHLFQISGERIQKVDPETGKVVASIPAPVGGASGMAWAEGTLWVGQYRNRRIHQVDVETGAVLRSIESTRFVTGVTWVDGELWHGTWDQADQSALCRIDPGSGDMLETVEMPSGLAVSGLESDGSDLFFCGGANSGTLRVVRRPDHSSGDDRP
jgi:glutamine cyclotransferase